MKKGQILSACALLALVGLVAAGCGGGGKKGSALSKDDYVAALNKICTNANSQLSSLGLSNTIDSFKTDGDQVVKIGEDTVDKIKALSPPDEVKAAAQEFTEATEHAVSDLKDATSAAKSGDQSKFTQALTHAQSDSAKGDAAASEMGADGCA
ncbi:MAG TPA: hypothetical protein VF895_04365 [Gaiellaceae bacterium]